MTPEQLKASILKYAMQGKLVEQKPEDGTGEDLFCKMQQVSTPNKNVTPIVEEEIPFDIPSSWKWCKFGELVDCSMGKTPPRAEPVWWQNDIHWVSISDMKDYGHISYTKEMVSQKALEEKFGGISTKGTLLMSFKLVIKCSKSPLCLGSLVPQGPNAPSFPQQHANGVYLGFIFIKSEKSYISWNSSVGRATHS